MAVSVPELRAKLNALYGWAWPDTPSGSDKKLAKLLGVNANNISIWANGQKSIRAPGMVPSERLHQISEIFSVPTEILTIESFTQFKHWLSGNTPPDQMSWRQFVACAETSEALTLLRRQGPVMGGTRSPLWFPPDEADTPMDEFSIGEEVAITFDVAKLTRENDSSSAGRYLTVLLEDPEKVDCFCPSESRWAPNSRLQSSASNSCVRSLCER